MEQHGQAGAVGHFRLLVRVRCPKCQGQIVEDGDWEVPEPWWRCLHCSKLFDLRAVELLEAHAIGLHLVPGLGERRAQSR